jgi:uncharacterized membrane protein YhaH (DUF805 family)
MIGGTMSFGEAIRTVLSKYADFRGRARRSEYWYWTLAVILAYVVCVILTLASRPLGLILYILLALGALIPGLAVSVRRLHDTGRSGWWILIGLVPLVGAIILLVFMCTDSQPGSNAHGASPKAATA